MKTQFGNLIGGKEIVLSGKYFDVASPFYPNAKVSVADSSQMDIAMLISKAKKARDECRNLRFEKRHEILKKSSKKINFSDKEMEYEVKMTGMPIKYVSKYLDEIPVLMEELPEIIGKKYGLLDGKIASDLHETKEYHKIEFREPIPGFVYSVMPGNDPRVTALVSTILVSLGLPGIIKPSKFDAPIAHKVVNSIIDAGYPSGALNVVFFDSSSPQANGCNFKLCDASSVIWPFGEDNTVDKILRFEYKPVLNLKKFLEEKNIKSINQDFDKFADEIKNSKGNIADYLEQETIDHFASKIVLRHASGRCAGILDEDFDVKKAAELITESSMNYPIGCNSMKSVFALKSVYDKLLSYLGEEFEDLEKKTGDPLKSKTEVGYIEPKLVAYMLQRVDELTRTGLINVVRGGEKISDMQVTPILATTDDVHSELLLNETSAYILGLKKCNSFENAVREVNDAAGENKKLTVSILTHNLNHMKARMHAHHVKINYLTTDIDGIIHEGNDYVMQLTKPQVLHLHKKFMKSHPYRS